MQELRNLILRKSQVGIIWNSFGNMHGAIVLMAYVRGTTATTATNNNNDYNGGNNNFN